MDLKGVFDEEAEFNRKHDMVKIAIQDEIDSIRDYLASMGEAIKIVEKSTESTTESMKTFTNASDTPIASHKVKAAKRRKQKRKNGGPR